MLATTLLTPTMKVTMMPDQSNAAHSPRETSGQPYDGIEKSVPMTLSSVETKAMTRYHEEAREYKYESDTIWRTHSIMPCSRAADHMEGRVSKSIDRSVVVGCLLTAD